MGHVVVPADVRHHQGVPLGQRREVLGRVVGLGHLRAVDEHGDDEHVVPTQGGGDLLADVVPRVGQPAPAALLLGRQPPPSDEGDDRVAGADGPLDHGGKALPGRDPVDVAEDLVLAEDSDQTVAQPAGVRRSVIPPVADDDAAHACRLTSSAARRPPYRRARTGNGSGWDQVAASTQRHPDGPTVAACSVPGSTSRRSPASSAWSPSRVWKTMLPSTQYRTLW